MTSWGTQFIDGSIALLHRPNEESAPSMADILKVEALLNSTWDFLLPGDWLLASDGRLLVTPERTFAELVDDFCEIDHYKAGDTEETSFCQYELKDGRIVKLSVAEKESALRNLHHRLQSRQANELKL